MHVCASLYMCVYFSINLPQKVGSERDRASGCRELGGHPFGGPSVTDLMVADREGLSPADPLPSPTAPEGPDHKKLIDMRGFVFMVPLEVSHLHSHKRTLSEA